MKVPLFPLSSHILPKGRMALRIFEPRYVRMVKEACASGSGFVICMIKISGNKEDNTHFYPLGTLCKVIDFDVLEDGLLGVTVEGQDCVNILSALTEKDGLRIGDCELADTWQCNIELGQLYPLNEKLKEIFQQYPEVSSLYGDILTDDTSCFNDASWVINRWIELLPLGAEQKQAFMMQDNCANVIKYLSELIE